MQSFLFGLRFDITAIVISNILFISLHLFPFSFFYTPVYQSILRVLFVIINSFNLLLNCLDIGLFRFAGKRATADVFRVMGFGNDFVNTVPKTLVDFWYVLLLLIFLVFLLFLLYPRLKSGKSKIRISTNLFYVTAIGGLMIIGWRGGIQYKPINIISASQYGNAKMSALILNTPFSFMKTYGRSELTLVHFMDEEQSLQLSPVLHLPETKNTFRKLNVVVIILESFGKEYIGTLNNRTGYTPFLDSLILKSLCFSNAFANGKRSIEGIPAIVAGIPALSTEPFISSSYAGNTLTTLASTLNTKGYYSTFFHGGTNGTMGFDNFSSSSGFNRYFGRKEYNDDHDFDSHWGIYDEPFLQRTIAEMNKTKQPFLSVIFTLSSHHPYSIPDSYNNNFKEGSLPIHRSIQYADHSLRTFFEKASTTSWYDSTLFVITADHTALSENVFYQNRAGIYSIPIIYFSPANILPLMDSTTTQQIDILPSILDFLHYDEPYFSYGESIFNQHGRGFAINFMNDTYQLISGSQSLIMEPQGEYMFYDFKSDTSMSNNLGMETPQSQHMSEKVKAFVQNYNRTMIENKMTIRLQE